MRRLYSWVKYGLIASRASIAKRADFAAAVGNAIDRAHSASPHALSAEGRRFAASKRRNPLGICLALASRSVRCLPIGRHYCALRSRRRTPANGSGDVAASPDARLSQRVAARGARTLPIGRVLADGGSTAACNHNALARHAGIQRRGCKMYERTHKRAFGTFVSTFDLALRSLLARLPRAFGTWVRLRLPPGQAPVAGRHDRGPNPGKPSKTERGALSAKDNAPR